MPARQVQAPCAAFELGDAQALPSGDGEFDAAVSGLVLNFVPDPDRIVAEMRRVVRPGGTVALYVWDYAGEDAADAALLGCRRSARPGRAQSRSRASVSRSARPRRSRTCSARRGLAAVATRAIDVPTSFRDFDDFWSPFLGGQGPAPGYCRSLTAERRERLREHLRATLPTQPDGRIALVARAWAVRGIVPQTA